MGASESTEAPQDQTLTQLEQPQTTQSAPSTTAPAPATVTPAPTTTPAQQTAPTSTVPTTTPSTTAAPASTSASTAPSTGTSSTTAATPTPTTPSLKPSQLQLQAVAANVSSLSLAPVAPAAASTSTPEVTPAPTPTAASAPQAAPAETQVEFEPYVLGDHTSGLWYSLVEWCAPFLPDGIVLAWDEEQVAELVQAISGSEYFRSLLTKRHQERRARLRALKDDPSATLPPLTNPDFAIPYDRAEQILDVDKRLGKLRKEFVPGRIAEDTFWYEYFLAVIQVIKAHVIGTQQHLRTQQIQVAQQQSQSQPQPQQQVAH